MASISVIRDELYGNRAIKRERVFRDRTNPLDYMTDDDLMFKYRFSRAGIHFLIDVLVERLERPTLRSFAIPVYLQVITALYYFACGSFHRVVSDSRDINLSKSSVCRIIHNFSSNLSSLVKDFIKFPESRDEIMVQHHKFYRDFKIPNVIGLIDGTQVEIISPSDNEDVYVNRMNYHSINVQIVCDFDYNIINIVAKWPGSVHDSTIFTNSSLPDLLKNRNNHGIKTGLLLGDSGYQCTNVLLTPYRNPNNHHQDVFNRVHKSCRSKVERTIGQLKRRWPCIQHKLAVCPDRACKIIVSCAILHNIAKQFGMIDVPDQDDGAVLNNESTVNFEGDEDTAMRDYIARNL